MQSIICKVKALPLLIKKEDPPAPHFHFISPQEFFHEIDELEKLIDLMIEESENYMVIISLWNKYPKDRWLLTPNSFSLVPSEALTFHPPH